MKLSRWGSCIALLVACFSAFADDLEITPKIIGNDFVVSLRNTSMIDFEVKSIVIPRADAVKTPAVKSVEIQVGKLLMVGQVVDIPVLSISVVRRHTNMDVEMFPLSCAGSNYVACTDGRTENVSAQTTGIPVSINLEHTSNWKLNVTTMLNITFARLLNQPQ